MEIMFLTSQISEKEQALKKILVHRKTEVSESLSFIRRTIHKINTFRSFKISGDVVLGMGWS
jgi:hypothetical protein